MEAFAGDGGLLPEQVWDSADIPERELFIGHAVGLGDAAGVGARRVPQAAPIAARRRASSISRRRPVERYLVNKVTSSLIVWRFNNKMRTHAAGKALRDRDAGAAIVHWSVDGWRTVHDTETRDTTLGVHVADLDTAHLALGDRVDFTFYWPEANRWEGTDFLVRIE